MIRLFTNLFSCDKITLGVDIMKSGFVSIVGRPNVGKSTLLNSIVNAKVAITSNVAGTTRNLVEGIYNEEDTQIIFIDTPGVNKPLSKLGKILSKETLSVLEDIDVILFLVDASTSIGGGDKFIMNILKNSKCPVVLVLNKIDKITNEELFNKIIEYKDLFTFSDIVPISALKDDNIEELIKVIKPYLKDNIRYYDKNEITNLTPSFMISELVREKVLRLTSDEVPHSITCVTTHLKEYPDLVEAYVDIIVERESQKRIVIGKNGSKLKEIGTKARREIEDMYYGKKVYLELFCKVVEGWKDKEAYLKELGFDSHE